MVQIEYSHEFEKQASKLELRLQKKLAKLLGLLAKNHYDPLLHTKSLSEPFIGILSFRVTRDWRVTFHLASPDTICLLEVKHRKDIYR